LLNSTQQVVASALVVVGQHHEKCTGKGYPEGLTGEDIHLYAKIASIADVFDALTTNRPYRRALESFPALQLMRTEMFDDFNSELFRELIKMLDARELLAGDLDEEEMRGGAGRAA
jgi:HD-GYP domain-containing protein (c-di-GMP phosphodiesterase class II)